MSHQVVAKDDVITYNNGWISQTNELFKRTDSLVLKLTGHAPATDWFVSLTMYEKHTLRIWAQSLWIVINWENSHSYQMFQSTGARAREKGHES